MIRTYIGSLLMTAGSASLACGISLNKILWIIVGGVIFLIGNIFFWTGWRFIEYTFDRMETMFRYIQEETSKTSEKFNRIMDIINREGE